ncbi:PAS domain S-box protein [Thermodesulfobacteriota bacterium]
MSDKPAYEALEKQIKDLEKTVSELTHEKEALKQHIAKYQAVLDTIKEFYFEVDLAGKLTYINAAAPEYHDTAKESFIGRNSRTFMTETSSKKIFQLFGNIYKTGEPVKNVGYDIVNSKGEHRFHELSASLLKDASGKPIGFHGTVRDITDLKNTENKLKKSEEKYRTILESIEDGYYEIDLKGNFTFFNDPLLKIHGYPRDELMNMNYQTWTSEKDRKKVFKIYNRVYRTGKPVKGFAWELIRKDGTTIEIEASAALMRNETGEPIGFRGVTRDITDRKQMEKALRESEERYRTILESMEEGYFEVDLTGNYTFVNDAMCKIRGYPKEELIGMNNKQFMDENTARETFKQYNKLYRTGEPVKNAERKIFKSDGSEIYYTTNAFLIKDDKGKPAGFRGTLKDTTEQKRLEAQLLKSQKMEAIGTLAGGVAHDLNNILSGLVSYPDLLLLDIPEDSPLRGPILTIQKSGQRAATIVQDLLTLARRGVSTMEILNINQIISDYLKSPEYESLLLHHPGIQIRTDLEADLLYTSGSPVHLTKTVMNLISNAVEAVIEEGEVTISTNNRYIDRPITGNDVIKEGDYVVLTVSDTGVGMTPEEIERVFEPFYTKKVMGRSGTGLGMAVVWGTVKDHDGYVDIKSAKGSGTTFTVYLPVSKNQILDRKTKRSIDEYMGQGESVLVVDDVDKQREIATAMLNKLGYDATSASSGEEAVGLMKDHKVDLIILDMIMVPGMDGLDTYKKIIDLHPGQKAIIASGYSETDRVRETQELGAGEYIKKPYTMEKIGLAVKNELEK